VPASARHSTGTNTKITGDFGLRKSHAQLKLRAIFLLSASVEMIMRRVHLGGLNRIRQLRGKLVDAVRDAPEPEAAAIPHILRDTK